MSYLLNSIVIRILIKIKNNDIGYVCKVVINFQRVSGDENTEITVIDEELASAFVIS